ncbi:L-cysteine desulfhydrase-like protein lolT1 [Penicillium sp. IBT 16267x]|nr:L-cysteine desulfhydrase-like protein lolT1 [Penicillium sp. IBT 16267x]
MTIDNKPTPFGKPMREHWTFSPDYHPINNGSLGAIPRVVQEKRIELLDRCEQRPDPYYRFTNTEFVYKSKAEAAKIINAPADECVFVKNTTTGICIVLYNLHFKENDSLIHFDGLYGALENCVTSLEEHTPLKARKVSIEFPIDEDELERRFRETIRQTRADGLNIRAALYGTIISRPTFRFPFERLTAICREEGILSIIDGAHGIGMIPLDMQQLQPDFFITNCNKWLYAPRPCSLMYCPKRNQPYIRTLLPTSWGFIPASTPAEAFSARQSSLSPNTLFEELFSYGSGTSDDSQNSCIPTALKFRREVCGGEEAIMTYSRELVNKAADMLADALGTEVLQEKNLKPGEKSKMRDCCMVTLRLPIGYVKGDDETNLPGAWGTILAKDWNRVSMHLQKRLMADYKTFVPIFPYGTWLWVRVCGQVYLDMSDFEWFKDVLCTLCEEVARKEY